MLAAQQSTEVAQEDERYAAIAPVVTQAVQAALRVGQLERRERGEIHGYSWSRIASAVLHSNFIGFSTFSALTTPFSMIAE